MTRPFARGGAGGGTFIALLLIGALLAFWGWHGGLWPRVLGFGGASISLLGATALVISEKR